MLKAALVHSLPGRARFRCNPSELARLEYREIARQIAGAPGVLSVSVNPVSGSILVYYETPALGIRSLAALVGNVSAPQRKEGGREAGEKPPLAFAASQLIRLFCPPQWKPALTVITALSYWIRGLQSLGKMKMDVPLLDASAIALSVAQGDYKSAGALMVLLKTGEYLGEWAKRRSRENIAEKISLNAGTVWVRRCGEDIELPAAALEIGDHVIVRTGGVIPVDGRMVSGRAGVNEASMTGESLGVLREKDDSVHAGTVVEEGELEIEVRKKGGDTRFQKILALIARSEAAKADTELEAAKLADSLVPFSFLMAGTTALLGGIEKAKSVLSVDYSCAIKLATPLAFLAAMREGLNNGVFFKGGAPMETFAAVDTIVFDKTGTLTRAAPAVDRIITYNNFGENEALKIAACLEEHFPHPVAKSIVRHARERGIEHREEHTNVKYIAAHGIVTDYKGNHTVIGSRHFIEEDECIDLSLAAKDEEQFAETGKSLLYLGIEKKLAAVFVIDDPLREEAREVIAMLRCLGVKRIFLLSGDNKRAAERAAKKLDIDSFRGELLPHEKADIIRSLKAKGFVTAMVGDGINDSPALSASDVGIAMKEGADLSRDVADITLKAPSLYPLVIARLIARGAIKKIHTNTSLAVSINSALMLWGIFGASKSGVSMVLHNLTTLLLSVNSMRPLLARESAAKKQP
ncbi:MAG: heavy metal translocating P-type ATPase [Treponema sp.]|jgi:Cu2+-exporting ATPase|nr:heavy metal translocating P-type ATPase [Treponema sp.]